MPGQKRVFALDVPGIHALSFLVRQRRGWPGRSPAMTTICFAGARIRNAGSIPILEFPAFQFPRRQRLHPPLFPAIRGPVTEARGFLDRREVVDTRQLAPALARCLADHIDEFGLVRHGALPRERVLSASGQSAPTTLTRRFQNASLLRQAGLKSPGLTRFLPQISLRNLRKLDCYANRYPSRIKCGTGSARKRYFHSLISTKCPVIAAAAAIAGDTRWVRPLNPWRPSKLRFEVEAQRSSGLSLSGFIA